MGAVRAISLEGTPADLLRFQRLSWSNLVFSVTQRCPLRCSHCVTSSLPALALPLLADAPAERWADELAALAQLGLEHVSFTGGEPTLALAQVARLARAARAASLTVSVTTSGSWGSGDRQVRRVADMLGDCVDSWDFGYDSFHADHLPITSLARAVNAMSALASAVAVRICDTGDARTDAVVAALEDALTGPVSLIRQPTYAVGRGQALADARDGAPTALDLGMPCLATGPFVRDDGSTGPCCAALSYGARGRHPFDYGSAASDGLLAVWRRWREDQLLRLFRLAGLTLPLQWIDEAGLLTPDLLATNHVCETCERLWDDGGRVARLLRQRASEPALQTLLDRLETELYGAVWNEHKQLHHVV